MRPKSTSEEITRQVKRPTKVTNYASGPGLGIQLSGDRYRNRLVMPFSQGPWGSTKVFAVLSDDRGQSWRYGDAAPTYDSEQANELQMAELEDGRLILNARSFKGNRLRKIAFSNDGGSNWSQLKDAPALVEPECQGSMIAISHNGVTTRLLYCGPADASERRGGALIQSRDGGLNWEHLANVYEGLFAYSSMCQLNEERVGVLFEKDGYDTISFAAVNIAP